MPQTVLIGIQARSGSTRLPNKALELISGKTMLDRVIEACKKAAPRINASHDGQLLTKIAVLTPAGDPIAQEFRSRCSVFEGPEHDVLSRYLLAARIYAPTWIVRVTGDCPLLPPYIISKLVSMAFLNRYDYVSNVDERFRTALDGSDCEVISADLLKEVGDLAITPHDREHVTTLIRRDPPEWAKIGVAINHFDFSHVKLSVDTPDDLERVRRAFQRANEKREQAMQKYGSTRVHLI